MIRFPYMLMVLILLSGCALTKERINLDYAPQKNIATIWGSENVGLKVNVTDVRQIRDNVGYKKNAYGMELGEIIPNNDIVELVRESIQTELRDRGFNVNGTDASVDIQLVQFYNDFKNKVFSADASAEVVMGATVKGSDGKIYYNKIITGNYVEPNIQFMTGNNAKIALEEALSDAVSKLVNDSKFIIALMETKK